MKMTLAQLMKQLNQRKDMKLRAMVIAVAIVTLFTQCDTLKNIPTNTSGGLFSLNGNWQLVTTTDNRAMEGTVVQVVPGVSDAIARTVNNNTYCLRERDQAWRNIKSGEAGVFTIEMLVNACTGSTLYKPATVTVLTNDEIRIKSSTSSSAELIQSWRRVPIQQ